MVFKAALSNGTHEIPLLRGSRRASVLEELTWGLQDDLQQQWGQDNMPTGPLAAGVRVCNPYKRSESEKGRYSVC